MEYNFSRPDLRIHYIRMGDRCLLCNIVDAQLVCGVDEQFHNDLRPICTVAKQAQITERLFGATKLPFLLA